MSIRVMSAVWDSAGCDGGELLVLLSLADHADDNGVSYPSVARLATRARLSERAVQYALRSLVDKGLVGLEPNAGPKGCNRYTVQNLHPAKIAPVQFETGGGAVCDQKGCNPLHPNHQEPSKKPSTTKKSFSKQQMETLYGAYPRKEGRGPALKAIAKAAAHIDFIPLLEKVNLYRAQREGRDRQFTPHPATWFNGMRWEDETLKAKPQVVVFKSFDDPEYLAYRAQQEAECN